MYYAQTHPISLITIWAIQRDKGGCPGAIDSNSCSGIKPAHAGRSATCSTASPANRGCRRGCGPARARAYSVNEVPETALSDEPGCGSARARTGGAVRVRSAGAPIMRWAAASVPSKIAARRA